MNIKFYSGLSATEDQKPFEQFDDIEKFSAATSQFPYWVVWPKPEEDGRQEVHYLHDALPGRVVIEGYTDEGGE